jgi:hypothetical protein
VEVGVPWIGTCQEPPLPLGWNVYGLFLEEMEQIAPNSGLLEVVQGICDAVAS